MKKQRLERSTYLLAQLQVSPLALFSRRTASLAWPLPRCATGLPIFSTWRMCTGVGVEVVDGQVVIDLYVVIVRHTISVVAHNVMESVKFSVERALSMPVAEVNVHVQGVHVSSED